MTFVTSATDVWMTLGHQWGGRNAAGRLNVECRRSMRTKSRRQNGLDALLPSLHREGSKKKKSEKHLKHWSREHHSFAFRYSKSESHRDGVPAQYLFGIWPEQNCLTEKDILPAQVSLSLPASVPRVRRGIESASCTKNEKPL